MPLAPLHPTDRITDAVYESLRDAIFRRDLQAGDRLSVPALAEQLGVSRSPVREAVVRLIQERLAREEPRRGAVVAHVSLQQLAGLYEVREVLEGLAARRAVADGGTELVAELTQVLHEHEQAVAASDLAAHMELDLRFHRLIRESCGNPEIVRLLDDIAAQVRLGMLTTTVTAGPHKALTDHRAILAAIASGDPDEAERQARAHVARLHLSLRQQDDVPAPSA